MGLPELIEVSNAKLLLYSDEEGELDDDVVGSNTVLLR